MSNFSVDDRSFPSYTFYFYSTLKEDPFFNSSYEIRAISVPIKDFCKILSLTEQIRVKTREV